MSTFSGFRSNVAIRGVPLAQTHSGQVFWVSNSDKLQYNEKRPSDGNKGTYLDPFRSLDKALTQCMPGRGDVIFIKPGYVEYMTVPKDILVDSLTIVGIGTDIDGPNFILNSTNNGFNIKGHSVTIQNIRICTQVMNTDSALIVSNRGAILENIFIYDWSGSFIRGIVLGNGTTPFESLKILGGKMNLNSAVTSIEFANASSYVLIRGMDIAGSSSVATIQCPSFYPQYFLRIEGMNIRNTHMTGLGVNMAAPNANSMMRDLAVRAGTKGNEIFTQTMGAVNCRGCSFDGCSDYIIPVVTLKGCSPVEAVTLVSATKSLDINTTTPVIQLSGGPVLIEWMAVEIVTTNYSSSITGVFTYVDAKTSTQTVLGSATDISSLHVGGFAVHPGAPAGNLILTNSGVYAASSANNLVVMGGTITFNNATLGGTNTSTVKYHIRYKPLDPNAIALMY